MDDQISNFGTTAKSLARNPLNIIALFIVLVYGFASLVTAFASSFTHAERLPLIYFLVVFPLLVLGVFAWLVSRHSGHLFAPSDFRNEENFVKMQMGIVASLTAASAKSEVPVSEAELHRIVEVVGGTGPARVGTGDEWRNHILWVDDRPENNVYERQAFEGIGLRFTLAFSTNEAFERLSQSKYAAIISDMGRREGPREGKGTCFWTDCGNRATRRRYFSTRPPMLRNISAKRVRMEGRGARTTRKSCSKW